MGDELLPNNGMLSVLNQVHRCLKWTIGLMNEVIKFWIFHEIGRMIMQKIGFVLCVPVLVASPVFAGDECNPRLFQYDNSGGNCITSYLTTIGGGQFHPKFEILNSLRVNTNCLMTLQYSLCSAGTWLAKDAQEFSDEPLIGGSPLEGTCGGCTYNASYALQSSGNLWLECSRFREAGWLAESEARLSLDPSGYQLNAEARPTNMFTDYKTAVTHELSSRSKADESENQFATTDASSSSGFADDVFWHTDVPFRVEQDMEVTLVLHAWRLGPDELEEDADCMEDGLVVKKKFDSTVWGGCAVYDSSGNAVQGLDTYAGWGQPTVVLADSGDLHSDRLSPRNSKGAEVPLPQGEYMLRSWFHSDTDASLNTYPNEEDSLLRIAAHNFEVGLYIQSADISGPGFGPPDGTVDIQDFSLLLVEWGTCVDDESVEDHDEIRADINHDGCVDIDDFSQILIQWGNDMN